MWKMVPFSNFSNQHRPTSGGRHSNLMDPVSSVDCTTGLGVEHLNSQRISRSLMARFGTDRFSPDTLRNCPCQPKTCGKDRCHSFVASFISSFFLLTVASGHWTNSALFESSTSFGSRSDSPSGMKPGSIWHGSAH